MPTPRNGVYIVLGEMSLITFAIRRSAKMSSHSHQDEDHDPIMTNFTRLKQLLMTVSELSHVDANTFLNPFLDVIRSEDTTGPITGLALSSINKILSYELVSLSTTSAASAVENIADAVTHARFVGTDPGSDEVVLMKILQVLRTLLSSSVGNLMSNESVCDIMQSCFRICFEVRLSELLRRTAEHALMDMTQVLFSRLPQLKETQGGSALAIKKSLKRTVNDGSHGRGRRERKMIGGSRKSKISPSNVLANNVSSHSPTNVNADKQSLNQQEPVKVTVTGNIENQKNVDEVQSTDKRIANECETNSPEVDSLKVSDRSSECDTISMTSEMEQDIQDDSEMMSKRDIDEQSDNSELSPQIQSGAEINDIASNYDIKREKNYLVEPYGLPCVRELLRFLVSLINPRDRRNIEGMIHMGLSLITMALESGATYIGNSPSLLALIKDELCRSLFLLLQRENLSLFASSLRVCFFLFESMRGHLKFQLEAFVLKLMDLISTDAGRYTYEVKELALESIVQLCRLPNLVAELYINFDCETYSSNLFEELIKLLSKHVYPTAGSYLVHILALEALLSVINIVENHCNTINETGVVVAQKSAIEKGDANESVKGNVASQDSSMLNASCYDLPLPKELIQIKQRKKLMQAATEQFNVKPKNGLKFMQEHGLISSPLQSTEVATVLRENRHLSKKMIGDYIGDRKNQVILDAFVKSFSYENTLIQDALRAFLETFRLPGESPVITRILETFTNHWYVCAGEPFGNKDAAFTLAYAIIMLNVDQHNENLKKQAAMTVEDFKRNLRGVNNNADFPEDMLEEIFISIKNEEIVMPSEQVGQVRDDYNWKMLLHRGASREGVYKFVTDGRYDQDLFLLIWGPTVAALSYIFDNASDEMIVQKAVNGFRRCALISSFYGLTKVFDSLVISLCKSTLLMHTPEKVDSIAIMFGSNYKAQLAARTVFSLSHRFGDILREGWENILNCILQLYRARLLPALMVDAEDFLDPTGSISIMPDEMANTKSDGSLLSSFYQYLLNPDTSSGRSDKPEDIEAQERAQACIKECHPEFLVTESKFLRIDSLLELIKALTFGSRGAAAHETLGTHYDEDAAVFFLELLIKVVIQNRDRIQSIWKGVREHLTNLILSSQYNFLTERAVVGMLRLGMRLLRREEMINETISSLQILLLIKPSVLRYVCKQITFGICELVRSNVTNITSVNCWNTLLSFLEVAGAGAKPPSASQIKSSPSFDNSGGSFETFETEKFDTGSTYSVADSEYSSTSQPSVFGGSSHSISQNLSMFSLPFSTVNSSQITVAETSNTGASTNAYHGRNFFVVVNKDGSDSQYNLSLSDEINKHDTRCLTKSCETLGFLIRDSAHLTPTNFPGCVHGLRVLAQATANGSVNRYNDGLTRLEPTHDRKNVKSSKYKPAKRSKESGNAKKRMQSSELIQQHSTSFDSTYSEPNIEDCYYGVSMQLLDLMHTLHIKASSVYESAVFMNSDKSNLASEEQENEECLPHQSDNESNESSETQSSKKVGQLPTDDLKQGSSPSVKKANQTPIKINAHFLWTNCWCPLLQGMAAMCLDTRKDVRNAALTNLQRSLLVHDMQKLSALEWEACFNQVLFPMLSSLIGIPNNDASTAFVNIEETRMRAAALLSKVFLQHLTQLLTLSTFTALWLTILDFMDKCMHADSTGLLSEAIPESLKNMLLVMVTARIFDEDTETYGDKEVASEKPGVSRADPTTQSEPNGQEDGSSREAQTSSDSTPKRSQLWTMTWERINLFLPNLQEELFGHTNLETRNTVSQPVRSHSTNFESTDEQESTKLDENVTEDTSKPQRAKSMSDLTHNKNNNTSICVVLQPPLPTLQSRANPNAESSSSTSLSGNVPILLTPNLINATANNLPVTSISKANTSASVSDQPAASDATENDAKPQDKPKTEQISPVFSI
ncbi:Golgi-specific brefeldin A-resistance guanine nucleotide exchange factor 1 [Trichoplax sp. H2]|nr:Golgi-specific brefeldin A-resistance guanine nucleotide exchange factor 1 [Trichoplax sp. H2]|eukprot:RDD41440.1 Golgi-specific brefeldin A-resistance guanine nucleotide exchange factor 1 [Trichoplax sp. H2]